MPRAELARLRRNVNRRILTRKKRQTAQKTLEQFEQVLFAVITTHGKKLNDADSVSLKTVVKAIVEEFLHAEKDEVLVVGQKIKKLFLKYGLTNQDLLAAIKRTRWAKLHNEILELEIKKGKDEIDAGYYTTIETKEELETFLANIKRRGLRRLKAKQKLKSHGVI